IGGNENKQGSSNENLHEQGNKFQEKGNTKLNGTISLHTIHPEQELGNPNISQSKSQPHLIAIPPELGQAKRKIVALKQRIQPTNDHDTRSKTGLPKSALDKSLRSPEDRANSDSFNHFPLQQERRIKANVVTVTEDRSAKRSKGNKTNAGSKKQKQRSNSKNQIEIMPNSETDQPDQLN
ncbi:MAG: hypothetical protein EZS28_042308, partial [Streblomastix strix]